MSGDGSAIGNVESLQKLTSRTHGACGPCLHTHISSLTLAGMSLRAFAHKSSRKRCLARVPCTRLGTARSSMSRATMSLSCSCARYVVLQEDRHQTPMSLAGWGVHDVCMISLSPSLCLLREERSSAICSLAPSDTDHAATD